MKNNFIKFNCIYDEEDYLILDSFDGDIGLDVYQVIDGEKTNLGIVLNKKQAEELIQFLQKQI